MTDRPTLMRLPAGRQALLAMYRRARREAVTPEVVEAATERRMAGDTAGACATAGVDLEIDFATVARVYGADTVAEIVEDVRHLAPDLLLYHVPRSLAGVILNRACVLRRYPAAGGANLMADRAVRDKTRLRIWVQVKPAYLEVLPDRSQTLYHMHRAYWDVRYTPSCGSGVAGPIGFRSSIPTAAP